MSKVKTLIVRTAGSNCDYETVHAFEEVGSKVDLIHINRVVDNEVQLKDYQILAIPGGFSYGDDIAAGKILANEFKYKLQEQLYEFVAAKKLIIGICNGFQVLVKAGLLPEMDLTSTTQNITIFDNDSGKFEDRWTYLKPASKKCVFTKNIEKTIYIPVAHAEGKFITKDQEVLDQLKKNDQIVFQYVDKNDEIAGYPWNPNGSIENIAGICDPTGRVFGLMPHPERHFHPTHHPQWTRLGLQKEGEGVVIFRNAMEYFE